MQEPLTEARFGGGVDSLAALDAEVEGPEDLGDADEEVAFC